MRVKFWGVRGTIPTPGPATVRYGGNTPCIEVRTDDGTWLILEAGSGIRLLGLEMVRHGPVSVSVLLSHTHWDHIQGFPFFGPIFAAGNTIDVYAPHPVGKPFAEVMTLQMDPAYYPVRAEERPALVRYHDLDEGAFTIGDATIKARLMNHTVAALGYRVEADGRSLLYTGDHEPYLAPSPDASEGENQGAVDLTSVAERENAEVVEFARGVDLLIADATYTAEEYEAHRGWGHSSAGHTLELAVNAGAKRLAMIHHDPSRTDDGVDRVLAQVRAELRGRYPGNSLEVLAPAEGDELLV